MRREYLISIVIAALLAGGVFAVYQFYLKERLERYAKDQLRLEQLEEKYTDLSTKFKNTQPKIVIEDVANRVNPWKEAVDQRGDYFNVGDFRTFEPMPDDVLSYKLYYLEKAPEIYNAFSDYLRSEGKSNSVNVNLWFHAPQPERVTNLRPNRLEVAIWLSAMHFGHSFVKMFIDADVITLRQMRLWEPRADRQVLKAYTAGVDFEMTMENLVAFLDELRFNRDRYYDVNAIRIKNQYLMGVYAQDPWLQVEMLVTTAEYDKAAKVKVTRSESGEEGGARRGTLFANSKPDDDDDEDDAPKISIMDRILKLFPF